MALNGLTLFYFYFFTVMAMCDLIQNRHIARPCGIYCGLALPLMVFYDILWSLMAKYRLFSRSQIQIHLVLLYICYSTGIFEYQSFQYIFSNLYGINRCFVSLSTVRFHISLNFGVYFIKFMLGAATRAFIIFLCCTNSG